MRKEVILGMTIGGTLLAVVIIYLTVSSNSKRDNHPVDTGGQIAEAGGAGDAPGQSGDGGAGTTGEYKPLDSAFGTTKGGERKADPRTADPHNAAPRDAAKHQLLVATNVDKMDPIWGKHLWPEVAVSVTPDPNAGANTAESNLPQSGGDQSSSPLSDPVSIDPNGGSKGPTVLQDRIDVKPGTTSLAPTAKSHTHKVMKGETFSTIAAAAYGSPNLYAYILRANPKIDPTKLKPGIDIILPDISEVKGPEKSGDKNAEKSTAANPVAHKIEATLDAKTEYRVQSGDSLHKISMKLYGKIDMVQKIYDLNKSAIGENPAKLKLGQMLKLPQPPTTN